MLLCIACVVALRVTDDESRRVFHYLRNRSRDWSILNNVTWGSIGAALATATCGGYIIITTGLLIAAVTGELSGRITELFLLGLGIILFGIVGSLSLASIESVPNDLIDNAAVLGALCLLTCFAFIADLLMSTPKNVKKHDGSRTFLDKETAARKKPTLSIEHEAKSRPETEETGGPSAEAARTKKPTNGTSNAVFDDSDETGRRTAVFEAQPEISRTSDQPEEHFAKVQRPRATEVRNNERHQDERQSREYAAQNFENVRTLRDSRRYADPERDNVRYSSSRNDYYRHEKIYRDQMDDQVDTPRFPATRDGMPEPMFAKIVNPSVKIMRVEREPEDTYDTRNSDSSQYDNVPTRMAGNPDGILKRHRDASFNVSSPLRTYVAKDGSNHDDIEMLEEWINVLKTTTGTQTGPSSPTDPGYVKHTANNWPKDLKLKTPGSSLETRK
ncbi:uncharacterized protein [Venturia canescens]|uniref:uncharacterized protein isoform X2 n=1 Tax=Venturia canescens TaxID=32260 RepID=UPI001C9C3455|nr:uncharacterized protein LOC122414587 isoform X2 [Venturia canescens]